MNYARKKTILYYLDILHQLAKDEAIPSMVWEVGEDDIEELENVIGDLREEIK